MSQAILNSIDKAFLSEDRVILDWYDGPMILRTCIESVTYYFVIHDLDDWSFLVFTAPVGFDSENNGKWGSENVLAFLANIATSNIENPDFYMYNADNHEKSYKMSTEDVCQYFADNSATIYDQLLFEIMRLGEGVFQTSGKNAELNNNGDIYIIH